MIYKNPEIAQKILEIVPLPLFIKDSKEELIYINQAESQLLGINLNNIPDKDRIHWLKNDLSVILENKIIERIYKFSERYYKVIKYPFEYQKETFIIGIAVDITEIQKSIERLSIFKNVLDNLQDGVILASNNPQKDYPVIYINKNFIESTGYSKEEVIGKNCRFLAGINPDVDERKKIKDCIRQLIPFEGIVTNYRKNGEEFKNHLRILPLRDLSGQVTLFLGLQKDITENYIYREEISKKEKLYRSIVNSRDDLIFKWRKNGDIYFVNQGFCNFFKKTMEMCIGRKSPFTILDLQISLENPIRKKRNKYSDRWIDWTHEGIFDGNNVLVEVQSIGRDITEILHAQESNLISRNTYQALFQNSKNFIVLVDLDGGILEHNHHSSRFGAEKEEVIWELDCWNSSPENQPLFRLTLKEEVIRSGKNIKQTFYLRDLNNKVYTYDFHFTPIHGQGKALKYVLIEGTWNEKFSPREVKPENSSIIPEFETPADGPWALKWLAQLWNYGLKLPRKVQKILLVLFIISGSIGGSLVGTYQLLKYNRQLQGTSLQREIETALSFNGDDPWALATLKLDSSLYTQERKEKVLEVLEDLRQKTSASRSVMRAYLPGDYRYAVLLVDNPDSSPFANEKKMGLNFWVVDLQNPQYSSLKKAFAKNEMAKRKLVDGEDTYVVYSLPGGEDANRYYISVDYSENNIPPTEEAEEQIRNLMQVAVEKINVIMDE